jgi:hypothetical protein
LVGLDFNWESEMKRCVFNGVPFVAETDYASLQAAFQRALGALADIGTSEAITLDRARKKALRIYNELSVEDRKND